jgi:hypothetical protein
MNNRLEDLRKVTIMLEFEELSTNFPGGTDENRGSFHQDEPIYG